MPPEGYYERRYGGMNSKTFFWDTLMEEQGVTPKDTPDAFFFEHAVPQEPFGSVYDNGNVIRGEFVVDEDGD
jgi:hypothetical protein